MKWIEMGAGGDGTAFRTYFARNHDRVKERVRKGCVPLRALPTVQARPPRLTHSTALAFRTSCVGWCGS